jgi:hypothetical protein
VHRPHDAEPRLGEPLDDVRIASSDPPRLSRRCDVTRIHGVIGITGNAGSSA